MKLEFRALCMDAIPTARRYFEKLAACTCDYTVGGMFMWRDYYKMEYATEGGVFFSRLYDREGDVYYNLPISDDMSSSLASLIEREDGECVRFCTVPEEYLPCFEALGRKTETYEQTDLFDYVYLALDMIELGGKKYSGQRNLISRFKRTAEQWHFCAIGERELADVRAFFVKMASASASLSEYAAEESRMVLDMLENFTLYGMLGGALYADGAVVGFSLGEVVGDTLFVHVEKADRTYKGAYQMLTNCFASKYAEHVTYINREEDMGEAGLRAAKMAYHPTKLLKKYVVRVIK